MHALRLILNEVSLKGVKVILTLPRPLGGLPYWKLPKGSGRLAELMWALMSSSWLTWW